MSTITIRPAVHADLKKLLDLYYKMDIAEMGSPMTNVTDLRNVLAESDIGAWVAVNRNRIVAFGALRRLSNITELRAQFACLPDDIDATSKMLEQLVMQAHANGVREISLWQVAEGVADPWLRAQNWKPVRKYSRMVLDLKKPMTITPKKDIDVRQAIGNSELQLVHKLIEETLEDHWGHHYLDFSTFLSTQKARPGHDLRFWYIASLGNQSAGAVIARLEGTSGSIALLGTRDRFRGLGVATALLSKAFTDLENHNAIEVTLDVDDANATNAARVYEKLGMKMEFSSVQWKLPV